MLLSSLFNGCHNMRKEIRVNFEKWAIAYHQKPSTPRYPSQVLAVEIHEYMSHGEWRTSNEIASELNEPLYSVRSVIGVVAGCWGYESHRKKGYRRLNDEKQITSL